MDADEEPDGDRPDDQELDVRGEGCVQAEDEEDEAEELPLTVWGTFREIAGGVVALFLLAAGVLALYVAGGVFLGFVAWAAPAVAAVIAAIVLARFLSRPR